MKNKALLIAGLTVVGVGAVAQQAGASEHGTFVDNADYRSHTRTEITGGKYSESLSVDTHTVDNWNYWVGSYSQKTYMDGDLNSPTGVEVNGQLGSTAVVDPREAPTGGQTPAPAPSAFPAGDPVVYSDGYTHHHSETLLVGRNWGRESTKTYFNSSVEGADYTSIRTFSETGHRSESGKYIR